MRINTQKMNDSHVHQIQYWVQKTNEGNVLYAVFLQKNANG